MSCIDLHRVRSSRIISDTAIVYDAGSVIYVNRPRSGAESLDRSDTMVNRLFGSSRLCDVDTVTMIDPVSGTFHGVVFLGEFVPYRRVQTDRPTNHEGLWGSTPNLSVKGGFSG